MTPILLALLTGCAPPSYSENPVITSEVADWRDQVIYQVLVDRFANGDASNDFNVTDDETALARYHGGDWQGLIDKVGYLSELGVNTIWITPVFRNVEEDAGVSSYHGYWPQSFRDTNPHFGDLAQLRKLVDVMHQNGIAVVFDVVVNHIGQLFYYDINQNGQPDITDYYATDGSGTMETVTEWDPSYDPAGIQAWTTLGYAGPAPLEWVNQPEINRVPPEPPEFWNDEWYNRRGRVTDWNDTDQVVYGDFPGGLKDLATENPNVRAAMVRVWSDWIEQTNVDGFRIDTVKHIEDDFWNEFCGAIRTFTAEIGKENFLMYGEAFDGSDSLIGSYTQSGMLDSAANFAQKYQVIDGVFKYGSATSAVVDFYADHDANWGAKAQPGGVGVAPVDLPMNFLDNHDTARFLYDSAGAGNPNPEAALTSALAYLFTVPGIPILYYGTEQGFDGGNDPANREPLWWSGFDTGSDLFQATQSLAELRKNSAALKYGDIAFTWTTTHTGDEEDAGILAFERSDGTDTALVVINTNDVHASAPQYGKQVMLVSWAAGTVLTELYPGEGRTWTVGKGGTLSMVLQPREALVMGVVE